jgi:TetR/AcrR family transcriptional repressor of nem operon
MRITRDPDRTRTVILESALREIHRKGFGAASLRDILAETGLTKGAFYHHFANKQAIGYAALELLEEMVKTAWLSPLEKSGDVVTCLQDLLRSAAAALTDEDIILGCPVNNLAQELSMADEGLRQRLVSIYDQWRRGIADALRRGQAAGIVGRNIDPLSTANFFVAAVSGARGLAKAMRNREILEGCADSLNHYLEGLRA